MKPLNRRLLIEVTEEAPQQGAFFVPVEEKIEEFLTAKVIACAEDCTTDLSGKIVVIVWFSHCAKVSAYVSSKESLKISTNSSLCSLDEAK